MNLANSPGLPRLIYDLKNGRLDQPKLPGGSLRGQDWEGEEASSGRDTRTVPWEPLEGPVMTSFPWWVSMILRLTVRPRPSPTLRVVKKGSGTFFAASGVKPAPLSCTSMWTQWVPRPLISVSV